jgi:hypothetical protein
MNSFLSAIQGVISDCSFKFDPSLTYEESIRGLRAIRSSLPISQEQVFPLFTYSLGPIKKYQQGRRQFPIQKSADPLTDPHAKDFISRICEFDITWKMYYSDIINFTTFEIFYMVEKSVNDVKEITVTLPELGDFRYFITWKDVDQVEYHKQDNLYISAGGTCTMVGELLIGLDPPLSLITEINARLKDGVYTDKVLDLIQITPAGTTYPPVP